MGVLEQVTEMRKQGIPDKEIITRLKEQRFSPKEIMDAIDQSYIKDAVSNNQAGEMEPSVTETPPVPAPSKEYSKTNTYSPKTKEVQETYEPSPNYPAQEGEYNYPSEQFYQPNNYGYAQEGYSSDTIIEIAEQVFSENIKKIQKKLEDLNEFKTLSQAKIENVLERVKRIEAIMDKLQAAILEKIGSYGKTLESIKKEMSMMEDSFGKIVNPLAEKAEKRHSKIKETSKNKERISRKK
ncbi:hypothetical protein DRN69_04125 [Candidatus Pacearchaeota archaeon]|nr:MAG: hypothetical protein DRN69_04125 [Candidatus Pacearchaeota archaeon]